MNRTKIELYNYCETLPINGWFQQCFTCDTITSSTIKYNSKKHAKKYIFEVYVCSHCQKKIYKKENDALFAKKCEKFIQTHLIVS
jgi:hypothetical protein